MVFPQVKSEARDWVWPVLNGRIKNKSIDSLIERCNKGDFIIEILKLLREKLIILLEMMFYDDQPKLIGQAKLI